MTARPGRSPLASRGAQIPCRRRGPLGPLSLSPASITHAASITDAERITDVWRTAIADDYHWGDAMVVNHDGPPDNTRCPTCHMYKRLCDCECDLLAEH